jgi:hypothetical protein
MPAPEKKRGCCTECKGTGTAWFTGSPCAECYATGHSHELLCGVIPDLTDTERDTVAYAAYTRAHNARDPRYAIKGVDENGYVMKPEAELRAEFERWRQIGDALTATGFNRPGDWA